MIFKSCRDLLPEWRTEPTDPIVTSHTPKPLTHTHSHTHAQTNTCDIKQVVCTCTHWVSWLGPKLNSPPGTAIKYDLWNRMWFCSNGPSSLSVKVLTKSQGGGRLKKGRMIRVRLQLQQCCNQMKHGAVFCKREISKSCRRKNIYIDWLSWCVLTFVGLVSSISLYSNKLQCILNWFTERSKNKRIGCTDGYEDVDADIGVCVKAALLNVEKHNLGSFCLAHCVVLLSFECFLLVFRCYMSRCVKDELIQST